MTPEQVSDSEKEETYAAEEESDPYKEYAEYINQEIKELLYKRH